MICLFIDGTIVAVGPDWMEHYFLEDSTERFPGKDIFIIREEEE